MEYTKLPDLAGLATLRAVVEHGGVSEAAARLHIGQPAVSKRLRALDSSYGLPLLERVGGRLRLTEAGEKVYLLAVQTLDRHFALQEELQRLAAGQDRLRLEVSFAIGEHFLSELLLRFASAWPDYSIDSRLGYSRQIQTSLSTGLADLALMEIAPDHPDILVQKWLDDEIVLVCGARHPLVGTELLPIEELTRLNYVLRERRSAVRETTDEALRLVGIEQLPVAMEVGSTDTIIDMLGSGRFVSFLPRFAVEAAMHEGSLFHLKITGFRIMRTLWIARHRSKLDHPVAEAFIDMLRESSDQHDKGS